MIEDLNLNNTRQALPDLPGESDLSNQYPYRNNEGFMLVVDIGLYEIAFTIVNNYHQVIYFDTQPTTKPEMVLSPHSNQFIISIVMAVKELKKQYAEINKAIFNLPSKNILLKSKELITAKEILEIMEKEYSITDKDGVVVSVGEDNIYKGVHLVPITTYDENLDLLIQELNILECTPKEYEEINKYRLDVHFQTNISLMDKIGKDTIGRKLVIDAGHVSTRIALFENGNMIDYQELSSLAGVEVIKEMYKQTETDIEAILVRVKRMQDLLNTNTREIEVMKRTMLENSIFIREYIDKRKVEEIIMYGGLSHFDYLFGIPQTRKVIIPTPEQFPGVPIPSLYKLSTIYVTNTKGSITNNENLENLGKFTKQEIINSYEKQKPIITQQPQEYQEDIHTEEYYNNANHNLPYEENYNPNYYETPQTEIPNPTDTKMNNVEDIDLSTTDEDHTYEEDETLNSNNNSNIEEIKLEEEIQIIKEIEPETLQRIEKIKYKIKYIDPVKLDKLQVLSVRIPAEIPIPQYVEQSIKYRDLHINEDRIMKAGIGEIPKEEIEDLNNKKLKYKPLSNKEDKTILTLTTLMSLTAAIALIVASHTLGKIEIPQLVKIGIPTGYTTVALNNTTTEITNYTKLKLESKGIPADVLNVKTAHSVSSMTANIQMTIPSDLKRAEDVINELKEGYDLFKENNSEWKYEIINPTKESKKYKINFKINTDPKINIKTE